MIILDVETTGLDPQKHSIVSVGAVEFEHPEKQFYQECRIWKGAQIIEEALAINGFTHTQVMDPSKKLVEEIIRELWEWTNDVKDKTLAGENPAFDRDFLKASFERARLNWLFGYRTIDLHSLCYSHYLKHGKLPPQKDSRTDLDTDKIFQYVGLPSEPKPHHALTGARMEAEAFSRLLFSKRLIPEFSKYPIPEY